MKTPLTRQRRRGLAALAVLGCALAVALVVEAGVLVLQSRTPSSQLHRVLPIPTADALASTFKRRLRPAPRKQMPHPVRIVIPAIGVSAPVIPLGLNRDRTLQVPKSFEQTGWFTGGPEPGEKGAAVIVGHVDSKRGPAVFYRIRALRRGDVIKVHLKNRTTLRFVVRSGIEVPKNRFPTRLVYGKTTRAELRLITCDGAFDRSTGHYVDNYVVFASLI